MGRAEGGAMSGVHNRPGSRWHWGSARSGRRQESARTGAVRFLAASCATPRPGSGPSSDGRDDASSEPGFPWSRARSGRAGRVGRTRARPRLRGQWLSNHALFSQFRSGPGVLELESVGNARAVRLSTRVLGDAHPGPLRRPHPWCAFSAARPAERHPPPALAGRYRNHRLRPPRRRSGCWTTTRRAAR